MRHATPLSLSNALCLTFLLMSPVASANPLDVFGFGARSAALGGTGTASTDDYSANYYNPANLVLIPSMQIALGYAYGQPNLKLNAQSSEVDRASGIYGGIILPNRALDNQLTVSLSFYLPDDRLTRIRSLPETQPRFSLFDNRPQRFSVTTSAAYALLPSLRLGAGITYVSDTRGTAELSGVVSVTHAEDSLMIGGLDFLFRPVRYPSVGVSWDITEDLRAGVSMREAFTFALDIGVSFRGDIASTHNNETQSVAEDVKLDLSSLSHNLFSPRQVNLGLAWTVADVLLSFDLSWLGWSDYRPPTPSITLNGELGESGLELPEPPAPTEVAFDDLIIPRVGIEWAIARRSSSTWRTRAGYFYEPTPIPEQTSTTNYIDSTKHAWSLGIGYETRALAPLIPNSLSIDWACQWIHLETRDHLKASVVDPVGDIRSTGFVIHSTLTLKVTF